MGMPWSMHACYLYFNWGRCRHFETNTRPVCRKLEKKKKNPSPVTFIACSHPLNQDLISHNVFPISNLRCLCRRRCPWIYKFTARQSAAHKSCLWSRRSCCWRIYGHQYPRYLTIRKACSKADPSHPDIPITQQAVDLPAQPPNSNPTQNLDQTIPLAFNEVPYPDFLEEICSYPKQLGCCWIQNGRKFCDYYSNIESKECANHQNWRCCDKIDRINFIGINCKKFQVKEPVPKKDEQPPDQQREESQPPEETWDLPDWLNWIMFPGFTDSLWQNQWFWLPFTSFNTGCRNLLISTMVRKRRKGRVGASTGLKWRCHQNPVLNALISDAEKR